MKRKPVQTNVTRITVRGHCDPTAGETAEDKLVKIIKKEAARECGSSSFTDTR